MTSDTRISYYQFLDRIRRNPGAYLSNCTLSSLKAYVEQEFRNGTVGLRPIEPLEPGIELFGDWIARRRALTKKSRTGEWFRLSADFWAVVRMVQPDDSQAFNDFFSLLDEFRTRTTSVAAEIEAEIEDDSRSGVVPSTSRHMKLQAVRLRPDPGYYLYGVQRTNVAGCAPIAREHGFYDTLSDLLSAAQARFGVEPNNWVIFDEEAK